MNENYLILKEVFSLVPVADPGKMNRWCRWHHHSLQTVDGCAEQIGACVSSCLGIKLFACTWNVSSMNNNPFEYWVTHPDPVYDRLMQGVQKMIEVPAEDIPIHQIFTDEMFSELRLEMDACRIQGLHSLESFLAGWLQNTDGNQRFPQGQTSWC